MASTVFSHRLPLFHPVSLLQPSGVTLVVKVAETLFAQIGHMQLWHRRIPDDLLKEFLLITSMLKEASIVAFHTLAEVHEISIWSQGSTPLNKEVALVLCGLLYKDSELCADLNLDSFHLIAGNTLRGHIYLGTATTHCLDQRSFTSVKRGVIFHV